jgi:predicted MFS family arabinose efflux permease
MGVMMCLPISYGLVLDVFQAEAWAIGVLEGAVAAGLIVGGLILSRTKLNQDKNLYVLLSLVVVAACLVGIRFSDYLWLSIALMGVAGVANVGVFVPSITMFQETATEGDKGRLLALRGGFGQVGSTVGFLLGGLVGEALGIRRAFLVAGLAMAFVSLTIYFPYRIGAGRRARAAREAALLSGSRRVAAAQAARDAALGVVQGARPLATGDATEAWTLAVEQAEMKERS